MPQRKELKGQCRKLLMALAVSGWEAPAVTLGLHLDMLNYRARITDLRHRWDIPIEARIQWVNGKKHTTYVVPAEARERACALLDKEVSP